MLNTRHTSDCNKFLDEWSEIVNEARIKQKKWLLYLGDWRMFVVGSDGYWKVFVCGYKAVSLFLLSKSSQIHKTKPS